MNLYRILLVGLCFFLSVQNSASEIYKWTDEKGNLHFSDRPPASKQSIIEAGKKPDLDGKRIDEVPEADSIILKLRRLLRQKKFDQLNLILDGYQADFKSDISTEERLFTAYNAFDIKDASYETLLNAWVDATFRNYQPYLARANYYYHMGWASRGTNWASETKKEQFDKMNTYFGKALKDIDLALGINTQSMVAYYLLIGIKTVQGKDIEAAAAARTALEITPASYKIREQFLWALTPRWGGSFGRMAAFTEESMVHVSENPRLKLLEGNIYKEAGDIQAIVGKRSAAEELYTRALAYGENHITLKKRGENSFKRGNYENALNDLNRAIELYAEKGEYYYWRSMTYGRLQQFGEALTDIERADLLEPSDEKIQNLRKWLASKLEARGHELNKSQKPSAAIEQYNAALRFAPGDASLYYRRARAFIDRNELDPAFNDLKKAIEIDPNEFSYYHLIDWVLAKRKDWDGIISYWDRYIKLNPGNSRAYVERGGAYYHKGDIRSAVNDAKIAADMGNLEGREAYEKFKDRVK